MWQKALHRDTRSFGLHRGIDRRLLTSERRSVRRRPSRIVAAVIAILCIAVLASIAFQWFNAPTPPIAKQDAVAFALSDMRGEIVDIAVASPVTVTPAAVPAPIPAHPLRTALVFLHVVGLVIGMGAALFLDAYLLARLYHRPIETHTAELVHFGTSVVSVGLAILWLSGLGLLTFYWFDAPQALGNPKIWAKVTVVLALTLNGMVLHRIVVPRVAARIGNPLLSGETLRRALLPLGAGVVSGVSWAFACTLGMVKEMNYCCPASLLLGCYTAALVLGVGVAILLHRTFGVRTTPTCEARQMHTQPTSSTPAALSEAFAPQGMRSLLMIAP